MKTKQQKILIGLIIVALLLIIGGILYSFLFGSKKQNDGDSELKTDPLAKVEKVAENVSEVETLKNGYYYVVTGTDNISIYNADHKMVHQFNLSNFASYEPDGIYTAKDNYYILETENDSYLVVGHNNKVITEMENTPACVGSFSKYESDLCFFVSNGRSDNSQVYNLDGKLLLSNVEVDYIAKLEDNLYLLYEDSNGNKNVIDQDGEIVSENVDSLYVNGVYLIMTQDGEHYVVDKDFQAVADGYHVVSSKDLVEYPDMETVFLAPVGEKEATLVMDASNGKKYTLDKDVHSVESIKEKFETEHPNLKMTEYSHYSLEKNLNNDILVTNNDTNSEQYGYVGIYRQDSGTVDYIFNYDSKYASFKATQYAKYKFIDSDNNIYLIRYGNYNYIYDFDTNTILKTIPNTSDESFSSYTAYQDGYYEICYLNRCIIYDQNDQEVVSKDMADAIYLIDKSIEYSLQTIQKSDSLSFEESAVVVYSIAERKFLLEDAGYSLYRHKNTSTLYLQYMDSVYIIMDNTLRKLNGDHVSTTDTDIYAMDNNTLEAYNWYSKKISSYSCQTSSSSSYSCKHIFRSTLITYSDEDSQSVELISTDGKILETIAADYVNSIDYTSTGDVLILVTKDSNQILYVAS